MGPSQSQIGKWLAEAREDAGLSQRIAAEALNTDAGTISRWERGVMPMSAEKFLALVLLYKADILELLATKFTSSAKGSQETRRKTG